MPLAIESYRKLAILDDTDTLLNLAWTVDEKSFLSLDVDSLAVAELQRELDGGLPYLNTYFVHDPYDEVTLGPAVTSAFPEVTPGTNCCVVTGAGVGSLLCLLARLATGRRAIVAESVYPDFPFWVAQFGGECVALVPGSSPSDHADTIALHDPALVFVERPQLVNDSYSDLDAVHELCDSARRAGAAVVIDESNANYYPQSFSATSLTTKVDNLVVLRGLSKSYGLGGLRFAYCVASSAMRERLAGCVPPLLASSISLRIAIAVVANGDVTGPLRARIAASKPQTAELLRLVLGERVEVSSGWLPYLLVPDEPGVAAELAEIGVQGKQHLLWSEGGGVSTLRLSVPLADKRMQILRDRIQPSGVN